MNEVSLLCHPATPHSSIDAVAACIEFPHPQLLTLRFRITGDVEQLQIPGERRIARADGLWKHTCFEAFMKAPDESAYLEFNFSPSRQWAVYRFDAYRTGMRPIEPAEPPRIRTVRREGEMTMAVDAHLGALAPAGAPLTIGLAAVLEDQGGALSYWALAHCEDAPNFHRAESFTHCARQLNV